MILDVTPRGDAGLEKEGSLAKVKSNLVHTKANLANARAAVEAAKADVNQKVIADDRVRGLQIKEKLATMEIAVEEAREVLTKSLGDDTERMRLGYDVTKKKEGLEKARKEFALQKNDVNVLEGAFNVRSAKDAM